MSEQIDEGIIRRLVDHNLIDFGDLRWVNCVLHNARMKNFATRAEYDSAIRGDDNFLFVFLLVYSFERVGFDSKLSQCACGCDWYQHGYKTKSHPVSVLLAFNEVMQEYGAATLDKLLEAQKIDSLAEKWFERSTDIHQTILQKKGFNKRGFNSSHIKSFLQFFHSGQIAQLRDRITQGNFGHAYDLLDKLAGIGPKVGRFVVRDLAFSLTNWGKEVEVDRSALRDPQVLAYAIPIDRWVRRVSIAIPTIFDRLKESLTNSDLAGDNPSNRIDEKLSLTIAKVCHEMSLNPMRFDLGAYLFGTIKRKAKVDEIYRELQKNA